MSAAPINDELHRLFITKADGSITEDEHQRLSSLLKESAARARSGLLFRMRRPACWRGRSARRWDAASRLQSIQPNIGSLL